MARKLLLAAAALMTMSGQAEAQARRISATGIVTKLWLADGQNMGLRVYLGNNGANQFTGCPYEFAYVNANHDNYQVYAAGLFSAFAQKSKVQVTFEQASSSSFCKISEIEIS